MPNLQIGRSVIFPIQNKSGGAVVYGDVVVLDVANSIAFTTTTTLGFNTGFIGVVVEPNGIANNGWGLICTAGYVPQINLSSAASLGDLVRTSTTVKLAVPHTAPQTQGDFGAVLNTGSTPPAILFGLPNPVPSSAAGDPWTEVIKSADQDVTNSSTLVNDTELQMSVTADTYHFILWIMYSGNTTAGDFKIDFLPNAGNMSGWYAYVGSETTGDAVLVSTGIRLSAAATITAIGAGTDASHTIRQLKIEGTLRFSSAGTFNVRFAQNAATPATVARIKKGSILRYRKLPVA